LQNIPSFKKVQSLLPGSDLVEAFKKELIQEKVSDNTIKNYLSDIKHFFSWVEKTSI